MRPLISAKIGDLFVFWLGNNFYFDNEYIWWIQIQKMCVSETEISFRTYPAKN